MNTIDIILLCCLAPSVYTGIRHGFVCQLSSLAALILGAYCASSFSSFLNIYIEKWLSLSGDVVHILSFTAVFIVVLFLVNLIGKGLKQLIHLSLLGWLDRMLGVIFSMIKAVIILSVAIVLLESLDGLWEFLPDRQISGSVLYPEFEKVAPTLFPYIKELLHA